ncbi:hypothetical protein PsYK624_033210 [Phanerochaete sordida]|uniref:Uncharacterized protein n=1 Tax=Phanerochaete sordida TaxID=48140 RepID=A0A9P3LAQ9_9APHY|nr:hypothetical protein PsYK624_033210 [Phanerochaete sordida]
MPAEIYSTTNVIYAAETKSKTRLGHARWKRAREHRALRSRGPRVRRLSVCRHRRASLLSLPPSSPLLLFSCGRTVGPVPDAAPRARPAAQRACAVDRYVTEEYLCRDYADRAIQMTPRYLPYPVRHRYPKTAARCGLHGPYVLLLGHC